MSPILRAIKAVFALIASCAVGACFVTYQYRFYQDIYNKYGYFLQTNPGPEIAFALATPTWIFLLGISAFCLIFFISSVKEAVRKNKSRVSSKDQDVQGEDDGKIEDCEDSVSKEPTNETDSAERQEQPITARGSQQSIRERKDEQQKKHQRNEQPGNEKHTNRKTTEHKKSTKNTGSQDKENSTSSRNKPSSFQPFSNNQFAAITLVLCTLLLIQFLICLWHNTYTLIAVFPKTDTCACHNTTDTRLGLVGTCSDWLQCFCYLAEKGKVHPFSTPIVEDSDDLLHNLGIQVERIYSGGLFLSRSVDVVSNPTAVQQLDVETLLSHQGLFSGFAVVAALFYPKFTLLHSTSGNIFDEMIFSVLIAIDHFTLLTEIYSNAPFYAKHDTHFAPLLMISLVHVTLFAPGIVNWYLLTLQTSGDAGDSNSTEEKHQRECATGCNEATKLVAILRLIANRLVVTFQVTEGDDMPALDFPVFLMAEIFNLISTFKVLATTFWKWVICCGLSMAEPFQHVQIYPGV